jgi:tetratricopeptide (TPR) repeat protein
MAPKKRKGGGGAKPNSAAISDDWERETTDEDVRQKTMLEDPKAHWDKLPQKQKLGVGGFAVVLLFFGLLPYLGEPLESSIEADRQLGGLSKYQMKQFADYFEQAEHYENQAPPDWDNAISKYEYCLSYTDKAPQLLNRLANAYIMRGKNGKTYNSTKVFYLLDRALTLVKDSDTEEAKAAKLSPGASPETDEAPKKGFLNILSKGQSYNDTVPYYYLNYAKALTLSDQTDKALKILSEGPKEIPSLILFHDFLKSGEFQPPQKAVYEYCAHFLEKMMSELNGGDKKTVDHVRKHLSPYLRGTNLEGDLLALRTSLPAGDAGRQAYDDLKSDTSLLTRVILNALNKEGKYLKGEEGADSKKQVRDLFVDIFTLHPNLADMGVKQKKKKKKEPEMIL